MRHPCTRPSRLQSQATSQPESRVTSRSTRARRLSSALTAALIVAAVLAAGVPTGAGAQTTAASTGDASTTSTADLRTQADALNQQYFTTLAGFAQADAAVRDSEAAVATLRDQAARAKAAARARAVVAYKSSGSGLAALIEGRDTIDAAHRAHLIDKVNAHDLTAYRNLRTTMRQLRAKQQALRDARQAQEQALADVKQQGAALDAKLAESQQRDQVAAAAQVAAVQTQHDQAAAAATTTTAPPTPPAPTPPPGYTGTPGTSTHHDDPFLSCVRARESGGNYSAVNPAGPYLGAYQFMQSTWNGAASHAGRADLVGVPANVASPFDQDEVAWSLYQWQGAAPWGGHCP